MELREMYEPSLMMGEDFKVNDNITIRMPTVGDIIRYGEKKYFGLVYLFCSTSSDYKAQLDSVGVDWQTISDFDMFRQLFIANKNQDMSILLEGVSKKGFFGDERGTLNTKDFAMARDNNTGEIVLKNKKTGVVIDRLAYDLISEYLCAVHGIEKHTEKAANKTTYKALIEEAKDKMEEQALHPYEPHFAELALSMACSPGFKADYFGAMEYPISVFMNHVRKVQQIKNFDNTMHGVYAGTVEFGKIPKAQLDWMSRQK